MTVLLLSLLVMNLWPQGAPEASPSAEPEHDTSTAKDALIGGRPVVRLGPVSVPTLTFYPGPKGKGPNAAVLVFPGGGYRILASDLEGTEICEWLNRIGLAAVLVKYHFEPKAGIRNLLNNSDHRCRTRSEPWEWCAVTQPDGTLIPSGLVYSASLLVGIWRFSSATTMRSEPILQWTALISKAAARTSLC